MNKKFTKLIAALALLVFMTPTMAGWGQSTATITFANQSSGTNDGSTAYTTNNFVSSGIANSDPAFGTITCSATSKCYSGKVDHGLKAGASSSAGSFTIAFSSLANVTKITLNRASYNTSNNATITVKNGSTTLASVSTPSGSTDFADMEITNLSIESLSGLTVQTSKYCYIKSITITYGNDKATTTTISDAGIINTNKFVSTEAGSLSASVTYGSPATAVPNASVTWSGNKDAVATINSTTGAVTLVGAGTVTFTAAFEGLEGYASSSATYVMTVTNEDPALSTIWSENFSGCKTDSVPTGGAYFYICTNGTPSGGTTSVKNEKLANGTAPELLVGKKGSGDGAQGGTFSATIPLATSNGYGYSGDLTLTYKTNANGLNVKTTTSGITVDGEASTGAGVTFNTKETHTVTFKGVNTSTENITIVFTATTTSNVRLDDIVLKGVITIPVNEDNEIVSNVTIPAGASYVVPSLIKVPSGKTLTVNGTLINVNAANLVIEEGGQLIHGSAGVKATVKKAISAHSAAGQPVTGWKFIASPIVATEGIAPTSVANMTDADFDLYKFNQEADLEWENYKKEGDHYQFNLYNGQGYLYANASDKTLEFAGTIKPSNTSVSVDIDSIPGAEFAGWNLVGNPFTFNAYVNRSYYKMNDDGSAILADVQASGTTIAPCMGIMVHVGQTGQSVTFSKEPIVNAPSNGNVSIAVVQANERGASATTVDKAIVSFNEGSELPKFYFGNPNASLYIPQGNKEYAIATSDGQGEMPLNFRANTDGQYTLTVNPEGVEMNYLHLIDNMTGNDIDLLQTPSYTFNATTRDYESRFRLVFAANNEDGVSTGSTTFAFYSNGNWMVNNEGEATLQIIDVMGRVLSNQTISGTAELSLNQQPGVYVLRLVNGNDVKTQKIVVR